MKTSYPTDGPICVACNATEADCARMRSCCRMCSHFTHLDQNGNSAPNGRPDKQRRLRSVK